MPQTECPLSATEFDILRSTINSLEECDDYGIGCMLQLELLCTLCNYGFCLYNCFWMDFIASELL